MNKLTRLIIGVAVLAAAVSARADTRTVSMTVTNGQLITYSDQIPASGLLDRIEITQTAGSTATVTVATYSGTTAVETFASHTAGGNVVVRPGFMRTTTAGTAITAAQLNGADTTNSPPGTVLVAQYGKPIIGGNLKLAVTAQAAGGSGTNVITVTLFFEPLNK
jgi:hypothetical protein